jgi:hypothetical protein
LVGGPVDGVCGQPMPVQVLAVQGGPASVQALHAVGDDQMGVQQRITLARCPVVEPDRQQPLSGHVLDTPVATAGAQVLVQVGDRLGQPSMMGSQHRATSRGAAEAVQDRDALGRPQDHVKGGHGVAAMRAAQQLASGGVAALEHLLEPRRRCFALQPQAAGAGAVPPAWGLPVAGQIRLVVGSQLPRVVGLPADREFGDVGHHPPLPSRRRWRQQRTPGGFLSSDDFGSSVERTAKVHPLWQGLSADQASDAVRPWRTWAVASGCIRGCRLWGDVSAARWR